MNRISDSSLFSRSAIQVVKDIARQTKRPFYSSAALSRLVFFLSSTEYNIRRKMDRTWTIENRDNQIRININYPHWQKSILAKTDVLLRLSVTDL